MRPTLVHNERRTTPKNKTPPFGRVLNILGRLIYSAAVTSSACLFSAIREALPLLLR